MRFISIYIKDSYVILSKYPPKAREIFRNVFLIRVNDKNTYTYSVTKTEYLCCQLICRTSKISVKSREDVSMSDDRLVPCT